MNGLRHGDCEINLENHKNSVVKIRFPFFMKLNWRISVFFYHIYPITLVLQNIASNLKKGLLYSDINNEKGKDLFL